MLKQFMKSSFVHHRFFVLFWYVNIPYGLKDIFVPTLFLFHRGPLNSSLHCSFYTCELCFKLVDQGDCGETKPTVKTMFLCILGEDTSILIIVPVYLRF